MANTNKPFGLKPVQYLSGSPWNGAVRTYSIPASYATLLRIGDPVTLSGTSDANGVPEIKILTAGAGGTATAAYIPVGVIVGLGKYESALIANPSDLDKIWRPASDAAVWYAAVVDDPDVIFEVQDIGTGTPLAIGDVGSNLELAAGAGTQTYISDWVLNNAAKSATAPYQVKLLGAVRRADNAIGQYCKWLVKFNLHFYANTAGCLGI